jgi:hypothetical protein
MGGCGSKPAGYPPGPITTTTPAFTFTTATPVGVVPGANVETITTTTTTGLQAPIVGSTSIVTPGGYGRQPLPFAGANFYGGATPYGG